MQAGPNFPIKIPIAFQIPLHEEPHLDDITKL